jgi:hypothetical protein
MGVAIISGRSDFWSRFWGLETTEAATLKSLISDQQRLPSAAPLTDSLTGSDGHLKHPTPAHIAPPVLSHAPDQGRRTLHCTPIEMAIAEVVS